MCSYPRNPTCERRCRIWPTKTGIAADRPAAHQRRSKWILTSAPSLETTATAPESRVRKRFPSNGIAVRSRDHEGAAPNSTSESPFPRLTPEQILILLLDDTQVKSYPIPNILWSRETFTTRSCGYLLKFLMTQPQQSHRRTLLSTTLRLSDFTFRPGIPGRHFAAASVRRRNPGMVPLDGWKPDQGVPKNLINSKSICYE